MSSNQKIRLFKHKKKDGTTCKFYNFDFSIGGVRYCRSTKLTERRKAQKFSQDLYDEIYKGYIVESSLNKCYQSKYSAKKIPIEKAAELFLKKPTKRPRTENRKQMILSMWNDFTSYLKKYAPGVKELIQVKYNHAEDYITMLQSTGRFLDKRDTMLAVGTTNRYIKDFRSIFYRLQKEGGIQYNPFEEEYTPLKVKDELSRNAFTIDQLKLIGKEVNMFVYHIFMIGINTGFRAGDICTLRWNEVDFKKNQISRIMLKTKKEVHPPILSHLFTYLKEICQYTGNSEFVSPIHSTIYLRNKSTISARVKTELNRLGIETQIQIEGRTRSQSILNIHSLRHAFCYYAMLEGVPLNVIQNIVGHIDERMTLMYANHAAKQYIHEKLTNFPDYLNPEKARQLKHKDFLKDHYYDRKEIERT